MKKVVLYSRSSQPRTTGRPARIASDGSEPPSAARDKRPADAREDGSNGAAAQALAAPPQHPYRRYERLVLLGIIFAALALAWQLSMAPPFTPLSDKALDAAVVRALEREPLPSPALSAYQIIAPSVVRVRTFRDEEENQDDENLQGVGSGVVIIDDGVILTNLHVVANAQRIRVTFANGFESDASVIAMQPEDDLAVLQAASVPDNVVAATMRSTNGLAPGERVVAVGFPFGLGPSASVGVVSGLQREFRSGEGRPVLTNLIQFDAAANPGSSGGPLVTSDGEVVGIVTGLLNPTRQGVFIGIGFAVPIENAAAAAGMTPF